MVYNWEGKEQECYRWYVEERRSLDELMRHMKERYNFEPSKRAYQTQFKRWDFPSKQSPAYHNAALVERVRQLWEKNAGQKEMLQVLKAEGFDIKERELLRVRTKNGWLLRGANGFQATFNKQRAGSKRKEPEADDGNADRLDPLTSPAASGPTVSTGSAQHQGHDPTIPDPAHGTVQTPASRALEEDLDPELQLKREQRRRELQQQSEELWASKKRRRRTRGYAGLPADPPGPPRFPSETTLDESKAFLHLDNEQYQAARDHFQSICEDEGVIKKTIAGPEKWKIVKDRLVAENDALRREFLGPYNGVPEASRELALDVICMDVTKRMRTMGRRMTISEAKNVLGLNPAQSRTIRGQFYDVLQADHFTSKLEAGNEHWQELKDTWARNSDIVKRILADVGDPPDEQLRTTKGRAIDTLCRDVMKRMRDDVTKRDPTQKRQLNAGPGPGPAQPKIPSVLMRPGIDVTRTAASPSKGRSVASLSSPARGPTRMPADGKKPNGHGLPQTAHPIDPSLVQSAPMADMAQLQAYAASAEAPASPSRNSATVSYQSRGTPIAALFRLSPNSPLYESSTPKIWFGTLNSTSVIELIQLAGQQHGQGAVVKRVEGIMSASAGQEAGFAIERDDELAAYLECVGGGRVIFTVLLEPAQ